MTYPHHPTHKLHYSPEGGVELHVLCRGCAGDYAVRGPNALTVTKELRSTGWRCVFCAGADLPALTSQAAVQRMLEVLYHPTRRGAMAVCGAPSKRLRAVTAACYCGRTERRETGTWGAYLANSGLPACSGCLWQALLGVEFEHAMVLAALDYYA